MLLAKLRDGAGAGDGPDGAGDGDARRRGVPRPHRRARRAERRARSATWPCGRSTDRAFAGAIADPVEAWLRCGPVSARHTIVHGRIVVRDGALVHPGLDDRLAAHRRVAERDAALGVAGRPRNSAGPRGGDDRKRAAPGRMVRRGDPPRRTTAGARRRARGGGDGRPVRVRRRRRGVRRRHRAVVHRGRPAGERGDRPASGAVGGGARRGDGRRLDHGGVDRRDREGRAVARRRSDDRRRGRPAHRQRRDVRRPGRRSSTRSSPTTPPTSG